MLLIVGQLLIIATGIYHIATNDKTKAQSALIMSLGLLVLGLFYGSLDVHNIWHSFTKGWWTALFLVMAVIIAELAQESGALEIFEDWTNSLLRLCILGFFVSAGLDNTAATALLAKIAKPTKGILPFAVLIVILLYLVVYGLR